jgi:hypothetical protein
MKVDERNGGCRPFEARSKLRAGPFHPVAEIPALPFRGALHRVAKRAAPGGAPAATRPVAGDEL